ANWSLSHDWYAKPQGGGLSQMAVVEGEGRGGSKCLRIVGDGKRGIAMQVFPVNPGKYRVTGWIKCENLGTNASILCEWMSRDGKWMSGTTAGSVTGTQDWTHFDTVVEAPTGARSIHLDLLTGDVNDGTVWFDDITMTREKSGFPPPRPPKITAQTPAGQEGCLLVKCDPQSLTAGALQLLVYCEEKPLAQVKTPLPVGVVDLDEGQATIQSLEVGKAYNVAAQVINGDGEASALGPEVTATVVDRQPPRAGWLQAEWTGGAVYCTWTPHLLDADVASIELLSAEDGGAAPKVVRRDTADGMITGAFSQSPHIYYPTKAQGKRLGVRCTDKAGNVGDIGWVDTIAEKPTNVLADVDVWWVPPTENVARNAQRPAAPTALEPVLMRGQRKGLQLVIRPRRDLHEVEVSLDLWDILPFGVTGTASYVSYVHLDANSIATPKEELVWPAPGDYPDEISADRIRDLPAGLAQPIYVELNADSDAVPERCGVHVRLRSREGMLLVPTRFRVSPVALPNLCRLPFVYWFSWGDPCKEFGVQERSADGWRVLYQIGRLMRAHHQRVVVVPWSMVRTWRDQDGKLRHDFRDFDRFIRTFQAAGVDQLFCLSHFGSRTTGAWECPTMGSHGHTVRDLATGQQLPQMDCVDLLPALQSHIEQLGLLKRFCVHVADEPIPVNVESYRQLSARVHAAAPKLPRIDAIHVPDLQGALEIWVPQINYFDKWRDEFRQAQAAGNQVWTYIAWVPQGKFPNRMIDGGAIKPRVLHWLNALDDTDGYLHWALNHWHIPLTSLNSPGDQYICWPSKRFIANSSLRYEAEREGLEDCELLFMVRDKLMKQGLTRAHAQAQMEAVGRKAVRGAEDYTHSWQELEAVRAELLGMLQDGRQ
ncbi:MAG: DUF4091 domain-containing protein, partial [Armatimonadetes bacterium]|nr:DUF4091 domain-containing protein [Armatimonadota bacterium]